MLAQIPIPTLIELGTWLVGFAAVLAIVVLVLTAIKLLKPGNHYATIERLERVEKETQTNVEKLREYTQERFHALNNAVNSLALKVTEQPLKTREMIDIAMGPILKKLDSLISHHAAMGAKLHVPFHPTEEL